MSASAIAFTIPRGVEAKVEFIAGIDPVCFFNGLFVQGDVPIARLVGQGYKIPNMFDDFWDRYINSEQAKPFHFGVVVLRQPEGAKPQADIWGWSYFSNNFWPVKTNVFDLAFRGDPLTTCLAHLEN
ncbi:MAG: hypothetical protein U5K75_10335 [Ahrensia sp.]|nr:hypothetical protein [Ahrensia sp.]